MVVVFESAFLNAANLHNFVGGLAVEVQAEYLFFGLCEGFYTVVAKYPSVTTVEMTVVEYTTAKSTSGSIQMVQPTEKSIYATVVKGYFKVGQTVEVYNSAGTKVGEATITEIKAGGTTSASGFAIPSDGKVIITLDKGFSDIVGGKSKIEAK